MAMLTWLLFLFAVGLKHARDADTSIFLAGILSYITLAACFLPEIMYQGADSLTTRPLLPFAII
jgi:hypothetical protein